MSGQSHVRFMQAPSDNGVVESHGETIWLRYIHVDKDKKRNKKISQHVMAKYQNEQ